MGAVRNMMPPASISLPSYPSKRLGLNSPVAKMARATMKKGQRTRPASDARSLSPSATALPSTGWTRLVTRDQLRMQMHLFFLFSNCGSNLHCNGKYFKSPAAAYKSFGHQTMLCNGKSLVGCWSGMDTPPMMTVSWDENSATEDQKR